MENTTILLDSRQEILLARIEEQERVMDQISAELHDNIGQLLSFTKMTMFPIARYAANERQALLIDKAAGLLDQVISYVNNISHSLSTGFVKGNGLAGSIRKDMEYIKLSRDMQCSLRIRGVAVSFTPDAELCIYRICQEAVNNVLKHANASRLKIELTYGDDYFMLRVCDDGAGFDPALQPVTGGIGFTNMRQRARLLGGSLDVRSQPAHGCTVTLTVPEMGGAYEGI